jgi:O-antigen ligase
MLQSAVNMTRERPWTGFGLGTFPDVYPAYALFDNGTFVNHAHNDWAEWAAEGGVPFVLLLLGIAVPSSLAAIRSGWGLGIAAVFLHGLVDFPMQRTGVAIWVFVIGALVAAERRRIHDALPVRPRPSLQSYRRQDQLTFGAAGSGRAFIGQNQPSKGALGRCREGQGLAERIFLSRASESGSGEGILNLPT